jgi:hypothetical protein
VHEGEGEEEEEEKSVAEKPDWELTDEERMLKLFSQAKYHLLPSFFKTLIHLKKQK